MYTLTLTTILLAATALALPAAEKRTAPSTLLEIRGVSPPAPPPSPPPQKTPPLTKNPNSGTQPTTPATS